MSDWRQADLDAFPPALRRLLDDELAAGNTIVELGHHHPAAPCGAFVMLASPVTTHPRASSDGIDFYQRNASSYSGEFADAKRHFFVLEAPLPPLAPPDMDAIRAAANTPRAPDREDHRAGSSATASPDPTPMGRFAASREMNLSKWRDGEGFDLEALRAMTPAERCAVEPSLIPPAGWREVEALAAIDSATARRALGEAAREGSLEVQHAVARHAPELVDPSRRIAMLVQALETAQITSGLSEALDQIETFHPPAVIDALFRGLLEREGDVAYHCAEMLAVIHGAVPSRYDWSMRPLFLRFNTDDREARHAALAELRTLCRRSRPT